jgi:hypothetical protein
MYVRYAHFRGLTDLPNCLSFGLSGARVLLGNMFCNLTSVFQGLSEPRVQMPIERLSFLWLPFAYTTFCEETRYHVIQDVPGIVNISQLRI